MEEKECKIRGENFTFDLYEDNERDMQTLNYVTQNLKYAYILHDRDFKDEERKQVKEPHIHVVIMYENAHELTSVAKELNLPIQKIQKVNNIRKMCRYLLHLDNPEKTEYDKSEIKTNVQERINKYCKKEVESGQVAQTFEFIYSIDRYLYYHEVLEYALQNNLYASFRRGISIFIKIIDEHNKLFLEKRESERQKEMQIKKEIARWEKDGNKRKRISQQ